VPLIDISPFRKKLAASGIIGYLNGPILSGAALKFTLSTMASAYSSTALTYLLKVPSSQHGIMT